MTAAIKPEIRYEDSAERRTGIEGWCCKACNRFWGDDEHMARYCCATSMPCQCGTRIEPRSWTICAACRKAKADAQWAALEKVAWDGETPVCQWDSDRYFFGEDILHHVEDRLADGVKPEDLRFVHCVKSCPPHFEMAEFLCDYLGPDGEAPDACREIDAAVNAWIDEHADFMWEAGGPAIAIESLMPARGDSNREVE